MSNFVALRHIKDEDELRDDIQNHIKHLNDCRLCDGKHVTFWRHTYDVEKNKNGIRSGSFYEILDEDNKSIALAHVHAIIKIITPSKGYDCDTEIKQWLSLHGNDNGPYIHSTTVDYDLKNLTFKYVFVLDFIKYII